MPLCRHLSNSIAAEASPVDGAPGRLRGGTILTRPSLHRDGGHPSHPNGAGVDPRSCRVSNSVCGQTCARPARRSCCERARERTEPCAPAPDPRHRARRGGYLVVALPAVDESPRARRSCEVYVLESGATKCVSKPTLGSRAASRKTSSPPVPSTERATNAFACGQAVRPSRGDRTRTCNPRFWRPVRYQLRHAPGLRGV